jgi:hypothetical protein
VDARTIRAGVFAAFSSAENPSRIMVRSIQAGEI